VPSCFRVEWGVVDSLYRPNRIVFDAPHLPSYLALDSTYDSGPRRSGESWHKLAVSDFAGDGRQLREAVEFAGWKSAGSDSVDVLLDVFPMSLRLRFASAPSASRARTMISWDTPGTRLATVQVIRTECRADEAAHPGA
jgi:hypothetical protein